MRGWKRDGTVMCSEVKRILILYDFVLYMLPLKRSIKCGILTDSITNTGVSNSFTGHMSIMLFLRDSPYLVYLCDHKLGG